MMILRGFFAAFGFLAVVTSGLGYATPAEAAKRLALVIGINDYPNLKTPDDPSNGQLTKAVADAETMGEVLSALRFEVEIARNVNRIQFLTAVERLKRKIGPGDTVFIFFAGHGVAFSGTNLLLPSDIPPVEPDAEQLVRQLSVPETDIIEGVRERGAALVILTLDACRNNPIEEFRRKEARRLARAYRATGSMREIGIVPRGSLGVFSIYSAGIGQRALDRLSETDLERNSVFTRVFARMLREPGRTLTDIIVNVRTEVTELAGKVIDPETRSPHQQFPAYYDETRGGHIILEGSPPPPPPRPPTTLHPPVAAPSDAVTRADFELAERINTKEVWEEFLRRHPTGFHAAVARQRLAAIVPPVPPPPPPPPPPATSLPAPSPLPGTPPPAASLPPPPPVPSAPTDAMETVRAFYTALGAADGSRASSLIIPEKRASGPFSAQEITKFYSSLLEPLRLAKLVSLGDNKYQADYTFRATRARACDGSAIVTIVQRGGQFLIETIKALRGC